MRHPSNRKRFVVSLWIALPTIVCVLLQFPLTLPKYAAPFTEILPPFALMAAFYWCLESPQRINYRGMFLLGLLQDILLGTPLGLSACLWVFFRYLLLAGRKDVHEQGFIVAWGFCSVLMLAVMLAQWLTIGLAAGRLHGMLPATLQWSMAVLLYPALHVVLYTIERYFYRRYWFILKAA